MKRHLGHTVGYRTGQLLGHEAEAPAPDSDEPVTRAVIVAAVEPVLVSVQVPWTVRTAVPWLLGLAAVGGLAEALHLLMR
jgi:hypothetical protein